MLRRAAVMGAMLLGAGACASNPGRSSAAVPLQIPEPPPRVTMAPVPVAEVPRQEQPAPPVVAPPPTAASAPVPAPAPRAATPPAAPPEPPRPATPPPELRPAPAAGIGPTAAQVLESLGRIKQKLDAIDPKRLNAGKRADYDSARRFLVQADAAAKENNLMLAQSSAAKAETLADGLR